MLVLLLSETLSEFAPKPSLDNTKFARRGVVESGSLWRVDSGFHSEAASASTSNTKSLQAVSVLKTMQSSLYVRLYVILGSKLKEALLLACGCISKVLQT